MTTRDVIQLIDRLESSGLSINAVPSRSKPSFDALLKEGFDRALLTYIVTQGDLPEERETVISWLAQGRISLQDVKSFLHVLQSKCYVIAVVGFSPLSALYQTVQEDGRIYMNDQHDLLFPFHSGVGSNLSGYVDDSTMLDEDYVENAVQLGVDVIVSVENTIAPYELTATRIAWENEVNLIYRVDTEAQRLFWRDELRESCQGFLLEVDQDSIFYTLEKDSAGQIKFRKGV